LKKFYIIILIWAGCQLGCDSTSEPQQTTEKIDSERIPKVELIVLGTIQDAGSPQIGCSKECCSDLFRNPDPTRKVVSLGIIDHQNQLSYLFEATPDLPAQMKTLTQLNSESSREIMDGIFLTHAHIGHYTGLMYLGKEAMDADSLPVYVMPKMSGFLKSNGPWDQLVNRTNIRLQNLAPDSTIVLTSNIKVTPLLVPHRDEYSETVGYRIEGPNRVVLFIPDIDKWSIWGRNIIDEVKKVDYAFLDATFYSGKELGNRDMSQIPHPSVQETMELFENEPLSVRQKIQFIHFNHTNPLLISESEEHRRVIEQSFGIAAFDDRFNL
jgi:pyrroloquinoline quinone biosynthesis protein B